MLIIGWGHGTPVFTDRQVIHFPQGTCKQRQGVDSFSRTTTHGIVYQSGYQACVEIEVGPPRWAPDHCSQL
jgi:hypothetical protein